MSRRELRAGVQTVIWSVGLGAALFWQGCLSPEEKEQRRAAEEVLDTMKEGTDGEADSAAPAQESADDLLRDMIAEKWLDDLETEREAADIGADQKLTDASGDASSSAAQTREDGATSPDGDISDADAELKELLGLDTPTDGSQTEGAPERTPDPEPAETVATAPPAAKGTTTPEPGDGPKLRSPPAPPAAQEAPPAEEAKPARPPGKIQFYTFFHKTAREFAQFLSQDFFDLLENGHVSLVDSKPREAMFFGDDAQIAMLTDLASRFDDMGLKLEQVAIRPKYIDVVTLMESLTLASVANVWTRIDETVTTNQQQGNKMVTIGTYKHRVYAQGGISQGQNAPVAVAPKVPYVFQLPSRDPFQLPRTNTNKGTTDELTMEFNEASSTEERGVLMAIGTVEDIARIRAFVDTVDRPAKRIMIEVQLVELDANKLTDLGLDVVQFGQRSGIYNFAAPLPGDPITDPGLPEFRRDDVTVPDVVTEGFSAIIDDTTEDISGRFIANIHALVRTGDAKVKARPKILTLDDRQSILHIGDDIPTFESTSVERDVTGGNFVENVSRVTTQYVGFTLNLRPKVQGEEGDEVALQLEVVANQLRGRVRVFEEDLAGIPTIARRKYTGQTRVRNHRPIILGGLIVEEETESTSKVPILGDIPILGKLFGRTLTENRRSEFILVVTPHILSDKGIDPISTPKESIHFDTFDSVLFNDRYIMKGKDLWGIDPITKQPAMMDGEVFSEYEVIDLTLLNIVKSRELVSKLGILAEYIPEESKKLSWLQRRYPERSVYHWDQEDQVIYYKAAALVIENIKELNSDMTYDELVLPRREIVLPTTPYRMSLTYDKYKTLLKKGGPVLRDSGTELSVSTVHRLRDVGMSRSMRQFAEYVKRNSINAERHEGLRFELQRLYTTTFPESNAAATDDYGELFDVLAANRIDFIAMATFFQDNLNDRYQKVGVPKIGSFERDLDDFMQTSITISQRAQRLRDLDQKWSLMAETSGAGK